MSEDLYDSVSLLLRVSQGIVNITLLCFRGARTPVTNRI